MQAWMALVSVIVCSAALLLLLLPSSVVASGRGPGSSTAHYSWQLLSARWTFLEPAPRFAPLSYSVPSPVPWPVGVVEFDGTGANYIDLNRPDLDGGTAPIPPFDSDSPDVLFMQFWVWPAGHNQGGAVILSCGPQNDLFNTMLVFIAKETNEIFLSFSDTVSSFGAPLPPNRWSHIAIRSGSSSYDLFVNGVMGGTVGILGGSPITADACYLGGRRDGIRLPDGIVMEAGGFFRGRIAAFGASVGGEVGDGEPYSESTIRKLAFIERDAAWLLDQTLERRMRSFGSVSWDVSYTLSTSHPFIRVPPYSDWTVVTFDGITGSTQYNADMDSNQASNVINYADYTQAGAASFNPRLSGDGWWGLQIWAQLESAPAVGARRTLFHFVDMDSESRPGNTVKGYVHLYVNGSGSGATLYFDYISYEEQPLSLELCSFPVDRAFHHVMLLRDSDGVQRAFLDSVEVFKMESAPWLYNDEDSFAYFLGSLDLSGVNPWHGGLFGLASWDADNNVDTSMDPLAPVHVLALAQPQMSKLVWTQKPTVLLAGEVNTLRFDLDRVLVNDVAWIVSVSEGASVVPSLLRLSHNATGSVIQIVPSKNVPTVTLSFSPNPLFAANTAELLPPAPLCFDVFDASSSIPAVGSSAALLTAVHLRESAEYYMDFSVDGFPDGESGVPGARVAHLTDGPLDIVTSLGGRPFFAFSNPSAFTIASWVRFERNMLQQSDETNQLIFYAEDPVKNLKIFFGTEPVTLGDPGSNFPYFQFSLGVFPSVALCIVRIGDPVQFDWARIVWGQWVHLAVSKGPDECALYINGRSLGVSGIARLPQMSSGPQPTMQLGTDNVYSLLDGTIADVGIWDRVLSIDEIQVMAASVPISVQPPASPMPSKFSADGTRRSAGQLQAASLIHGSVADAAVWFVNSPPDLPYGSNFSVVPGPSQLSGSNVLYLDPNVEGGMYVGLTTTQPRGFDTSPLFHESPYGWVHADAFTVSMWVLLLEEGFDRPSGNTDEPLFVANVEHSYTGEQGETYFALHLAMELMLQDRLLRFTYRYNHEDHDSGALCEVVQDSNELPGLVENFWWHLSASVQKDLATGYWTCRVLVNGRLVGQGTGSTVLSSSLVDPAPGAYAVSASTSTAGVLGAWMDSWGAIESNGDHFWDGTSQATLLGEIADFDVWGEALSTADLHLLASTPPPALMAPVPAAPVATQIYSSAVFYAPFTQPLPPEHAGFVESVALDDASQGYATFDGTQSFDAAASTQYTTGIPAPMVIQSNTFTVSVFARTDGLPVAGSETCLWESGDSYGDFGPVPLDATRLSLVTDSTGATARARLLVTMCPAASTNGVDDCVVLCDVLSHTALSTADGWHQLTGSLNEQGDCSIFIDGKIDAQWLSTDPLHSGARLPRQAALFLRSSSMVARCASADYPYSFHGGLSALAYFERALSEMEVAALWMDPPAAVRAAQAATKGLTAVQVAAAALPPTSREWNFNSTADVMFGLGAGPNGLPVAVMDGTEDPYIAQVYFPTALASGLEVPLVGLPGNSFTIQAWVSHRSLPEDGTSLLQLCSDEDCPNGRGGMSQMLSLATERNQALVLRAAGQAALSAEYAYPLNDEFHLISIVFDMQQSNMRLYVNAALQAVNWLPVDFKALKFFGPYSKRSRWLMMTASTMRTRVAQVRMYNVGLTSQQVRQSFYSPPPSLSHLLAVPLHERLLRTAQSVWRFPDSGFDGSVTNLDGASFEAPGLLAFGTGSSAFLDLSLPTNNPLAVSLQSNYAGVMSQDMLHNKLHEEGFSIAMYVRPENVWTQPQQLFGLDVNVDNQPPFALFLMNFGFQVRLYSNGNTFTVDFMYVWTPADELFMHVVLTVSHANVVRVLVAGEPLVVSTQGQEGQTWFDVLPRTTPLMPMMSTWFRAGGVFSPPADTLQIGSASATTHFGGRIESVAFFTRVLSTTEALELALHPLAVTAPASIPAAPVQNLRDTANFQWTFQTPPANGDYALAAAPVGDIGTVAFLNGTRIDLSIGGHDAGVAALTISMGGAGSKLSFAGWFLLRSSDVSLPLRDDLSLLDLSSTTASSAFVRINYMHSTRSVRVSVNGNANLLVSPANSVQPDMWVHVACVFDDSKTVKARLYVNGGLQSSYAIGAMPFVAGARDILQIGRNSAAGLYTPLSVGSFEIWRDAPNALTEAQVLELARKPPQNVVPAGAADTIGSDGEYTQLMQSAAGVVGCRHAPVGVSQPTWRLGAASNTGLCHFSGAFGLNLSLSTPSVFPTARVWPAKWAAPLSVASGITASLFLRHDRLPTLGAVRALACGGTAQGPAVAVEVDATGLYSFRHFASNAQACALFFTGLPRARAGRVAHVVLQIAPLSDTSARITLSVDGVSSSASCSSYTVAANDDVSCSVGGNSLPGTGEAFQGTLASATLFRRVLTSDELTLLRAHGEPAYTGRIELQPDHHLIDGTAFTTVQWRANRQLSCLAPKSYAQLYFTSAEARLDDNSLPPPGTPNAAAHCGVLVDTSDNLDTDSSFRCGMAPAQLPAGTTSTQGALLLRRAAGGASNGLELAQHVSVPLPVRVVGGASDAQLLQLFSTAVWTFSAEPDLGTDSPTQFVSPAYTGAGAYVKFTSIVPGYGLNLNSNLEQNAQPLPAVLLPLASDGFTLNMWVRLPLVLNPFQSVFAAYAANYPTTRNLIVLRPRINATTNYALELVSPTGTCTATAMLSSLGAYSMVTLRYAVASTFAGTPARVSILQNGVEVGAALCTNSGATTMALTPGATYGVANIGGGYPGGGAGMPTLEVMRVEYYDRLLRDFEVAVLANVVPEGLSDTDTFIVDAPEAFSTVYPVANLTIRPGWSSGRSVRVALVPVWFGVSTQGAVGVSPSELVFSSTEPQSVTVTVAVTADTVSLELVLLRDNGEKPSLQTLCIPVHWIAPWPTSETDLSWQLPLPSNNASVFFFSSSALGARTPSAPVSNSFSSVVRAPATWNGYVTALNEAYSYTLDSSLLRSEWIRLTDPAVLSSPASAAWPTTINATGRGVSIALMMTLSTAQDAAAPVNINWRRAGLLEVTATSSTADDLRLFTENGRLVLEAWVAGTQACTVSTSLSNLPTGVPALVVVSLSPVEFWRVDGNVQHCRLFVQGSFAAEGDFAAGVVWRAVPRDLVRVGASTSTLNGLVARIDSVAQWPFELQTPAIATLMAHVDNWSPLVTQEVLTLRTDLMEWNPVVLAQQDKWWQLDPSISDGAVSLRVDLRATWNVDDHPSEPFPQPMLWSVAAALQGTSASTTLLWVKFDMLLGDGTALLDCGVQGSFSNNLRLVTGTMRYLSWQIYNHADLVSELRTPDRVYQTGHWVFIAVVVGADAVDGTPYTRFYVGGQLVASTPVRLAMRVGPERETCTFLGDSQVDIFLQASLASFSHVVGQAFSAAEILAAASQAPYAVHGDMRYGTEIMDQPTLGQCDQPPSNNQPLVWSLVDPRDAPSYSTVVPSNGFIGSPPNILEVVFRWPSDSARFNYTADLVLTYGSTGQVVNVYRQDSTNPVVNDVSLRAVHPTALLQLPLNEGVNNFIIEYRSYYANNYPNEIRSDALRIRAPYRDPCGDGSLEYRLPVLSVNLPAAGLFVDQDIRLVLSNSTNPCGPVPNNQTYVGATLFEVSVVRVEAGAGFDLSDVPEDKRSISSLTPQLFIPADWLIEGVVYALSASVELHEPVDDGKSNELPGLPGGGKGRRLLEDEGEKDSNPRGTGAQRRLLVVVQGAETVLSTTYYAEFTPTPACPAPLIGAASTVPASPTVGTAVRLRVKVTPVPCPTGQAKALTFTWLCTSHPGLLLNTSNVEGALNSTQLRLTSSAITQAGTYTFSATAMPGAVVRSVTLVVQAAIVFSVPVAPSDPDPCLTSANPCRNGGKCVSSRNTVTSVVTLSCVCVSLPEYRFLGRTCSFAVLEVQPNVSPYIGGAPLQLWGMGLDAIASLSVQDIDAELGTLETHYANSTSSKATALLANMRSRVSSSINSVQLLAFTSPTLFVVSNLTNATNPPSAYKQLEVVALLPATTAELQLNLTNAVYYTSRTCTDPGLWRDDGAGGCLSCPACATCPGGNRVWPTQGCWSASEFTKPVRCTVREDVCLGAPEVGNRLDVEGQCKEGFSGTQCLSCAADYYRLQGSCAKCPSSEDQSGLLALTMIVALGCIAAIAVAVGFLQAVWLSRFVQAFVTLQAVAQVGVEGSKNLPLARDEFTTIFSYLNLINFDVEVLRAGCGVIPNWNYVKKFQMTIAFMSIAVVMFTLACLARYCVRVLARRRREAEEAAAAGARGELVPAATTGKWYTTPQWRDFKERIQHSVIILCTILYLRLTLLQFRAFVCTMLPDPTDQAELNGDSSTSLLVDPPQYSYLKEDAQTRCYTGEHALTVSFVFILLVVFTAGFPFICYVLLMRAFHQPGDTGPLARAWGCMKCLYARPSDAARKRAAGDGDEELADDTSADPADASLKLAARKGNFGTMTKAQIESNALLYSRVNSMGYLFVSYRLEHFDGAIRLFVQQAAVAAITVFVPDSDSRLKLFLFGLVWMVQTLTYAVQLPMDTWMSNVRKIGIGLASLAHAGLMLSVQSNGVRNGYFYVLLVAFVLMVVFLVFRKHIKCEVANILAPPPPDKPEIELMSPDQQARRVAKGKAASGQPATAKVMQAPDESVEVAVRPLQQAQPAAVGADGGRLARAPSQAWGEEQKVDGEDRGDAPEKQLSNGPTSSVNARKSVSRGDRMSAFVVGSEAASPSAGSGSAAEALSPLSAQSNGQQVVLHLGTASDEVEDVSGAVEDEPDAASSPVQAAEAAASSAVVPPSPPPADESPFIRPVHDAAGASGAAEAEAETPGGPGGE